MYLRRGIDSFFHVSFRYSPWSIPPHQERLFQQEQRLQRARETKEERHRISWWNDVGVHETASWLILSIDQSNSWLFENDLLALFGIFNFAHLCSPHEWFNILVASFWWNVHFFSPRTPKEVVKKKVCTWSQGSFHTLGLMYPHLCLRSRGGLPCCWPVVSPRS